MRDAEPINWLEKGEAKGLEVEIVERCLNNLGIEVKHEFHPWARAQKLVEDGLVDGMMTTPNDTRFEYSIFGKEISLVNYWNIFVKSTNKELIEEAQKITELEELKNYTLTDFIGNGWSATFMKEEDGYNIQRVARLEQLPLMITNDRVQMMINSSNWINWWSKKQGVRDKLTEIDCEDIYFTRFHFVFMLSRKSPWVDKGLIRAMDIELQKMKESGEWHEILRKYEDPHGFGKPFTTELNTAHYYIDYDNYPIYQP